MLSSVPIFDFSSANEFLRLLAAHSDGPCCGSRINQFIDYQRKAMWRFSSSVDVADSVVIRCYRLVMTIDAVTLPPSARITSVWCNSEHMCATATNECAAVHYIRLRAVRFIHSRDVERAVSFSFGFFVWFIFSLHADGLCEIARNLDSFRLKCADKPVEPNCPDYFGKAIKMHRRKEFSEQFCHFHLSHVRRPCTRRTYCQISRNAVHFGLRFCSIIY